MYDNRPIVRTKFAPPRPPKHTLARDRVSDRLLAVEGYRLAIVRAGTGFGKSTAAAALKDRQAPLVWYHLAAEDADPFVFLRHLVHAFSAALDGFSEEPLAALEAWQRSPGSGSAGHVLDALVNELDRLLDGPLLLVIDDAHRLNESAEAAELLDRLIARTPPHLHSLLLTRYRLALPSLLGWRVRGELLEISQAELAFTADEITRLFAEYYGRRLTPPEVELLCERVEGWPIALPLIWQRLQRQPDRSLADALGSVSGSASDLFAWLVQEVLAQQPAAVGAFLKVTAVLRDMTSDRCDQLRGAGDSRQMLEYLHENGLFVVDLGEGHSRYHHLFRDVLRHQLSPDERRETHLRAARIVRSERDIEEAIYHFLAADALVEAGELLSEIGRDLVRSGRLDTLSTWLAALPPEVLQRQPNLMTYLGDIARLQSRFAEALGWYEQAVERSRAQGDRLALGQALRGQARVYLDTVNPSRAEELLQEALRLADGIEDRESQARLLSLMAENLLNRGRFKEAETYQAQVRQLRQEGPSEVELPVRLLLRTGRLAEARAILEQQAEREKEEPVLRPRAHRETHLLLSLVLAFQGDRAEAYRCAVLGTERGEALNSDFITAVGWMRQGHAHLLTKNRAGYEQARHCFQKAIAISERLMVPRLKVEAFWGLTQAYGFQGDLNQARQMAEAGLALASEAGDDWIAAELTLTLGASFVLAGDSAAAGPWLHRAAGSFDDCGDTYGQTITLLWLCLLWLRTGDSARLRRDAAHWLALVRTLDLPQIVTRPVLLGPPDPRALVPLLLWIRDEGLEPALTGELLAAIGVDPTLQIHPGYQLRVQLLGPFRLWRGREEVPVGAWKRQKARQLCLLLMTRRESLLDREQIIDRLWPELDSESGERDFKIAYNTLLKVLEPERDRQALSAFILRDGSRYGLRPEADLWLDTTAFERQVALGDDALSRDPETALTAYREAVALYQGEFLQEYPYEEWASEERERFLTLFLRTAERLARLHAGRGDWRSVTAVCEQILARDDCWEEAYRLSMRAYAAMGQRALALRTYQRCVERLAAELDVPPAATTVSLFEAIAVGEKIG